jgi:organic radical activating enzyme
MSIRVHPCLIFPDMKLARLGDGPEIFHTLQGEGISAGCPAVFIRASRCNLHCVWCDTDHTWNFEGTPWIHEKDRPDQPAKHNKQSATFEIPPQEIAELALRYSCPRLVLTGGEPLLQQDEFLRVIELVRARMPDCFIEVETNGTRRPSDPFATAVDQFNVSPKLANSGIAEALRLAPDVLAYFATSPKAWFKFVITSPDDLEEVRSLIQSHNLPHSRILLMPEGRTSPDLDTTAPWLADACRDLGFRFSDRLHVRLWGDKRGV